MESKKIGEILKETSAITEESLRTALEVQRATGERLGATLLRLRLVDSEVLVKALGQQCGVEGVNLDTAEPTRDALALLTSEQALQTGCLPLERQGDHLAVATADPRDEAVLDRIKRLTRLEPKPFVAPQSAIYKAIKRHYRPEDKLPKVYQLRVQLARMREILSEIETLLED